MASGPRIGRQPIRMTAEQQGRIFHLWDFRSSWGGIMLIRSFGGSSEIANIDIVFHGVRYMEIASSLRGIVFAEPDNADIDKISGKFGPDVLDETTVLFKLISDNQGYLVVATTVEIYENHMDRWESPLEIIANRQSRSLGILIATDSIYKEQ